MKGLNFSGLAGKAGSRERKTETFRFCKNTEQHFYQHNKLLSSAKSHENHRGRAR